MHTNHLSVAAEGGARGARAPPNFPELGAEPLQKYMCVTSSTSREQYCLSGTYA